MDGKNKEQKVNNLCGTKCTETGSPGYNYLGNLSGVSTGTSLQINQIVILDFQRPKIIELDMHDAVC